MVFLKEQICSLLRKIVGKKFPEFRGEVIIEYPLDPTHGDYASPIALELGKAERKNPQSVGKEIIEALKTPPWISDVKLAPPGFLNFFLAPGFLTDFLGKIDDRYGESKIFAGKTIATDTSHPNVAKTMGVHHLLSTIIGNSLNRIFAAVGYNVIRDNYLGDWGTQFGKLLYAIKKWGNEDQIRKNPIPELLKLYVKFHEEAEKTQKLEEYGRSEFKKLENGDVENRKLWQWIRDLSIGEFQTIWKRLGVSFDYIHGESFYEDKMQDIIDLGIQKKVFVQGEGGALIAPLADTNMPPCIIRKSDGATLYATRDLARMKYWEDTWHPELGVNVVDTAQTLYFKQLFEVAKMLGITDAENIHVSFGRMKFPEKRMSTRKGNIVLLEDLLNEAEQRAYIITKQKNPDLSEEQKKEVAKKIGIGAVKYAVLSQNRLTDITFSWEKILSLEGNTAPYLQYAYARGKSILRKNQNAKIKMQKDNVKLKKNNARYIMKEQQELGLARILPKFPEIVLVAAQEFKPNLIANYLFALASKFNAFYASLSVLEAEDKVREARLQLVKAVTTVLKNGLELLGIEAPEEM